MGPRARLELLADPPWLELLHAPYALALRWCATTHASAAELVAPAYTIKVAVTPASRIIPFTIVLIRSVATLSSYAVCPSSHAAFQ